MGGDSDPGGGGGGSTGVCVIVLTPMATNMAGGQGMRCLRPWWHQDYSSLPSRAPDYQRAGKGQWGRLEFSPRVKKGVGLVARGGGGARGRGLWCRVPWGPVIWSLGRRGLTDGGLSVVAGVVARRSLRIKNAYYTE